MCSYACRNFYGNFILPKMIQKYLCHELVHCGVTKILQGKSNFLQDVVCHTVLTKRCMYLSMTFAQEIKEKKK